MKTFRFFAFLLLIYAPVLLGAQANQGIRVDTLPAGYGSMMCLDTSVTSFKACIIAPGGIAIEKYFYGCFFISPVSIKPGTVIIFDKISSRNSAGGTVRLPARKYVMK